jgi:hypothetical protein
MSFFIAALLPSYCNVTVAIFFLFSPAKIIIFREFTFQPCQITLFFVSLQVQTTKAQAT